MNPVRIEPPDSAERQNRGFGTGFTATCNSEVPRVVLQPYTQLCLGAPTMTPLKQIWLPKRSMGAMNRRRRPDPRSARRAHAEQGFVRLAGFVVFNDFAHFMRNYLLVVDLIKTAEEIRLITYEVAAPNGGAEHPLRRAHGDAVHLDQR